MLLVCENDIIIEVPESSFATGLSHLMAAYYVFHVAYPKSIKTTLYFIQDVTMNMQTKKEKRPVRYTNFLTSTGLDKLET